MGKKRGEGKRPAKKTAAAAATARKGKKAAAAPKQKTAPRRITNKTHGVATRSRKQDESLADYEGSDHEAERQMPEEEPERREEPERAAEPEELSEEPSESSDELDSDVGEEIRMAANEVGRLLKAAKPSRSARAAGILLGALKSSLAATKGKERQMEKALSKSKGGVTKLRKLQVAAALAKFVDKPRQFDGKGNFQNWKKEVDTYFEVLSFPAEHQVSIVKGLLKGDALNWWCQQVQRMTREVVPLPSTWAEMEQILNGRFDTANPDLAARNKLQHLKQGHKSVHQYIKQFEDCYAQLSSYDEADKIYRFLAGLNPDMRIRFSINPGTNQRWTRFEPLIAYITAFVADECTAGALLDGPPGVNPHLRRADKRRLNAINRPQQAGRDGRKSNLKEGSPTIKKVITNANGQRALRSARLISHLTSERRCRFCYQEGHQATDCTNPAPAGFPSGYHPRHNEGQAKPIQ